MVRCDRRTAVIQPRFIQVSYRNELRVQQRVTQKIKNKALPYKAAASKTTNSQSNQYESFSLNCPHVADANNNNVRIEVTWTLNDTIWLKIEDGEKRIFNKLTRFYKRTVAGKTVLRVLLNNGRYFFDYDELTGDFAMEIRPVHVREDVGVWQCHVTVHQKGNTHTLTSRSRVRTSHALRSHTSFTGQLPHAMFSQRRTSGYPQSKQRVELEGRELNKARTKGGH
uniref:Ig-like domain-containing protein n=1 Tax=Heterorhabditis bacteriophora TaxID=37862 RepID=A0A1I7X3N5_HETBA